MDSMPPPGLGEGCKPRLPRGVRLQFDEPSGEWLLLAPERIIKTNAAAVAILSRCSGEKTLGDIIDDLATAYAAPRGVIAADAHRLVGDLASRRLLDL